MSSEVQTDTTGRSEQLDTQSEISPRIQEFGKQFYYYQNIHKEYKDSIEQNPILDLAWRIFQKGGVESNISDYNNLVLESGSPIKVQLNKCIFEYFSEILHSKYRITEGATEEPQEAKLFIHDRRLQGLKMDWKRARELYKRLSRE